MMLTAQRCHDANSPNPNLNLLRRLSLFTNNHIIHPLTSTTRNRDPFITWRLSRPPRAGLFQACRSLQVITKTSNRCTLRFH
jgi:hypothetical protein